MGSWHELPSDLLLLIAERLPGVDDFARLGAVCKPWTAALTGSPPTHFPWLGLWSSRSNEVAFFCSEKYRIYRFPKPTRIHGRTRIAGYRDGWLVAFDESFSTFIFNPITGDRVNLPSFSTLLEPNGDRVREKHPSFFPLKPDHDGDRRVNLPSFSTPFQPNGPRPKYWRERHVVTRVTLSSTPSSAGTDIFVAAAYSREGAQSIVFARVGDITWSSSIRLPHPIRDIIYYHDTFFVLYVGRQYQVFDPHGSEPKLTLSYLTMSPVAEEDFDYSNLLLSPSGDLLMVGRETMFNALKLKRFLVLMFDPEASSPSARWKEIKDLGDRSGNGFTASVAAGNVSSGIRRNCIYFFNLYQITYSPVIREKPSNMYLFDMEKGVFEFISIGWLRRWDRPLFWFTPSLSCNSSSTSFRSPDCLK